MAKLTYSQRKAMPSSAFAIPGNAPGAGSYPVNDLSHARNALARVAQHGTPAEQAAVRRKVAAKFPGITQSRAQRRSTEGSPPFSRAELAQGHRKIGALPLSRAAQGMAAFNPVMPMGLANVYQQARAERGQRTIEGPPMGTPGMVPNIRRFGGS